MNEIIKEIVLLSKLYPKKVKLHKPISFEAIVSYEKECLVQIDEQLIKLYEFSNGISFIDYCIFGLKNQSLADLYLSNKLLWEQEPHLKNSFVNFMGAMGGRNFGFIANPDTINHQTAYFQEDMSVEKNHYTNNNYQIVANSIEMFFIKFLQKISFVLQVNKEDASIWYIDDELLPNEVRSWE